MLDFIYCLEYDSSTSRNGCTCEGICRCAKISNVKINVVHMNSVVEEIILKCKVKKKDGYFIDRICTILKLYDSSMYDVHICNGYYGEEVGSITIQDDLEKKLTSHVKDISELNSLNKKIMYVLNLEYGFIPNHMIGLDFTEKVVDKKHLSVATLIKRDNIYSERIFNYPLGVVRRTGLAQYQIIDGNHRIFSLSKNAVLVFVGE